MAAAIKLVIPEQLKQIIAQKANGLVETKSAPMAAANAESAKKYGFNYVVGVHTAWREGLADDCLETMEGNELFWPVN